MNLFTEEISLYAEAKDRWGRYCFPDDATHTPVRSMQMGDFLFGGYWQDEVNNLREMIATFGVTEAKKRPEYNEMKRRLPGATLSGLFNERRKTDFLTRHSGYLCLDIDNQDNTGISDFSQIMFVLRHRAEVACAMRSCSGKGLFALVRLAQPDKHKEQFRALYKEYFQLGIHLDRACSDVTRLRFASFDTEPYINENVVPYAGVEVGHSNSLSNLAPRFTPKPLRYGNSRFSNSVEQDVERLICKIENRGIDITATYEDWINVGFALATLGNVVGRHFFHRVSRFNKGYSFQQCDEKFNSLCRAGNIKIGTFFVICKNYGVTFRS